MACKLLSQSRNFNKQGDRNNSGGLGKVFEKNKRGGHLLGTPLTT